MKHFFKHSSNFGNQKLYSIRPFIHMFFKQPVAIRVVVKSLYHRFAIFKRLYSLNQRSLHKIILFLVISWCRALYLFFLKHYNVKLPIMHRWQCSIHNDTLETII